MPILTKKLPTLIALLVLVIGLVVAVILASRPQLLTPKAGPDTLIPKNIKVTNVGTDTFTVSFTTAVETVSYLLVGTDPELSIENTNQFLDNRNQISGNSTAFLTHYITVANGRSYQESQFTIEMGQTLYYKIGLGGITGSRNLFDNQGQPFSVQTAAVPNNNPADIVSGMVLENGAKTEGVLVYLSLPNAGILSDQTKQGRFVIPLNTAYFTDLSQPATYDTQATVVEFFFQGDKLTSTVKSLTGIKNLPDINLGENYDLTEGVDSSPGPSPTAVPAAQTTPPPSGSVSPTPTRRPAGSSGFKVTNQQSSAISPQPTVPAGGELTIANPAKENETLATAKPEFRGTGPAGKVITLTIESEETITASITVGADGGWTYTPPQALSAGNHVIKLAYVAGTGEEKTVSRSFAIASAQSTGSDLPAFTATSSARVSPTKTPTPTPITRSTMPATDSGVPESGTVSPTIYVLLTGIILFLAALVSKSFLRR